MSMPTNIPSSSITLLDGGMGRELQRMGAPFRQPEWSALALYEAPEQVAQAHRSFIDAGSQLITANNYAVVPFHLGDERFERDGTRLATLAGEIARKEADSAPHEVRVAGSLPPAMGSYRPDLFDQKKAEHIHKVLVDALTPYVDIWLAETTSSLDEAKEVLGVLKGQEKPVWLSFTLDDTHEADHETPTLRSGDSLVAAVELAIQLGVERLLFNCSQPEIISRALELAAGFIQSKKSSLMLGAYANAFVEEHDHEGANEEITQLREDLMPERYLTIAKQWVDVGATAIGGCCGIGPEYIALLSREL